MQRKISALWIVFLGMCLSQPIWGIGITGKMVDYRSLPVEGVEVVVIEQEIRYYFDYDMTGMSDVVHTDAQGHFALDYDCHDPREVYVVARKSGSSSFRYPRRIYYPIRIGSTKTGSTARFIPSRAIPSKRSSTGASSPCPG